MFSANNTTKNPYRQLLYITTCLSSLLCVANIARALPEGAEVKAGDVSFSQNANEMHIHQTTDKAIVDWRGFDIHKGELTQFHQPSSSSMTLNRVISKSPTKIDGTLRANGQIILLNQNGILFGNGAVVDVNGIIAATNDIDNNQFMSSNNKLEFIKPGSPSAQIINDGKITAAEAGLVGFIAPEVINNGRIIANAGKVILASGETATIDMYGDKIIEVAVSETLKKQLIENKGLIEADGGKIILTAAAGKEIVESLINIEGELKSSSIGSKNGEIYIYAEGKNAVKDNIEANKGKISGNNSKVTISGKVTATGNKSQEKGGKIIIAGDEITLKQGSIIDASGFDGKSNTTPHDDPSAVRVGSAGGEILIGGNYLGKGDIPTAETLTMEEGAIIKNNAINSGDAGRTILWSDGVTTFAGDIFARALGGKKYTGNKLFRPALKSNEGNGGFIETSGKKVINASGFSYTESSNGLMGVHLFDPTNIWIYGNVDRNFVSTDGSINLASKVQTSGGRSLTSTPKVDLNASLPQLITLTYLDSTATATGSSSSNTLTVSDPSKLAVGMQVRLSNTSLSDTADVFNNDTYSITAISGDTVTISGTLRSNYTNTTIYVGHVSSWVNSADNSNNAYINDTSKMPLWIFDPSSGKRYVQFNGSTDLLNINLSFMNDPTFGRNGVPTTSFIAAKTTEYGSIFENPSSGGNYYAGFRTEGDNIYYTMDYVLGSSYLPNSSPSEAFSEGNVNILAYQWLPDSPIGASWAQNQKNIYANTHLEISSTHAGTVGPNVGIATIGNTNGAGGRGAPFSGQISRILMYNAPLTSDEITLISQSISSRINSPLSPPGTGSTEAEKAMAPNGYSVFDAAYLKKFSSSSNINLVATSDIVIDLQGSILNLTSDSSFILTSTGGDINAVSPGFITTRRTSSSNGNIIFTADSGSINVAPVILQANNNGEIIMNVPSEQTITFNPNNRGFPFKMNIGEPSGDPATEIVLNGIISANDKVYDGTTSGTFNFTPLSINEGVINGATPTALFNIRTVGSRSAYINDISITIGGSSPDKQYIYQSPPTYYANINKATIEVTSDMITSAVYTGTTTLYPEKPTITPFGTDVLTLDGTLVATLSGGASKNVGSSKAVNFSGLTLGGSNASNYDFTMASSGIIDITPAPAIVSGLTVPEPSKIYDTTTSIEVSGTPSVTPLGSDDLSVSGAVVASYVDKNVGNSKALNLSGLSLTGADSENYFISYPNLTASITPATLTINGIPSSVVYNTDTFFEVSSDLSVTPLGSDNIELGGEFYLVSDTASAGAATNPVFYNLLLLTGPDAANYNFNLASYFETYEPISAPDFIISRAPVSLEGATISVVPSKVYDGTTSVSYTVSGTPSVTPLGGDDLSITGEVTASYLDKNVGTNKPLTINGLELTGDSANNYSLVYPIKTASITRAPLPINGIPTEYVYNGSTSYSITEGLSITPFAEDSVTLNGTLTMNLANKNVGIKTPSYSGISFSGADANNYWVEYPAANITINKAPINIFADNIFVVYPNVSAEFTFTYTGLVGEDTGTTFTGKLERDPDNSVGTHKITKGTLAAEGNYEINEFQEGNFVILPPKKQSVTSPLPSLLASHIAASGGLNGINEALRKSSDINSILEIEQYYSSDSEENSTALPTTTYLTPSGQKQDLIQFSQ